MAAKQRKKKKQLLTGNIDSHLTFSQGLWDRFAHEACYLDVREKGCDECRRGRRVQTQEDGKSKQAVLSTYLCQVSAPEVFQRVVFCNFTPQDGLHISCAISLLAALLEEFPCCSLKRMSQPQPESLGANICGMRLASIKPSGCRMIFYFFSPFLGEQPR